ASCRQGCGCCPGSSRRLLLWYAGKRARWRADIAGRRPDQLALPLLFEGVSGPAGSASAGEHRREQLGGHFREIENDSGPEFDVCFEYAVRLAFTQLGERCLLGVFGDFVARCSEVAGRTAQHPRARILGTVDAVPEAHQPLAAIDYFLDV